MEENLGSNYKNVQTIFVVVMKDDILSGEIRFLLSKCSNALLNLRLNQNQLYKYVTEYRYRSYFKN